jgi:hypothetical protein
MALPLNYRPLRTLTTQKVATISLSLTMPTFRWFTFGYSRPIFVGMLPD